MFWVLSNFFVIFFVLVLVIVLIIFWVGFLEVVLEFLLKLFRIMLIKEWFMVLYMMQFKIVLLFFINVLVMISRLLESIKFVVVVVQLEQLLSMEMIIGIFVFSIVVMRCRFNILVMVVMINRGVKLVGLFNCINCILKIIVVISREMFKKC